MQREVHFTSLLVDFNQEMMRATRFSLTSDRNWTYLLGAYKMLAGPQSLFHLVSGPSRWYLNNNDATTYWSRGFGESPFDRIFIPADRREFKYSRQYVLRSSDLILDELQ